MILLVLGLLILAIGVHLFRTRSLSRRMLEEERRTGKETSIPQSALGAGYVFPFIGVFLIVVGLIEVL